MGTVEGSGPGNFIRLLTDLLVVAIPVALPIKSPANQIEKRSSELRVEWRGRRTGHGCNGKSNAPSALPLIYSQ